MLKTYTHHRESIRVPDLKGFTVDQVEEVLESKALRYAIIDSAYAPDQLPRAVIEQNPKPNTEVKENRRIYLTINASTPPMVQVPNVIYSSLRNAEVQLKSVGLKVGHTEYIPDPARNAVLDIKQNGKKLKPGDKVNKGSSIDLVLGNGGITGNNVPVPKLIGLTFKEAKIVLMGLGLNLGATIEDGNISNTGNAIVYHQSPESRTDATIGIGEPIDVFIKKALKPKPKPAPIPTTNELNEADEPTNDTSNDEKQIVPNNVIDSEKNQTNTPKTVPNNETIKDAPNENPNNNEEKNQGTTNTTTVKEQVPANKTTTEQPENIPEPNKDDQ